MMYKFLLEFTGTRGTCNTLIQQSRTYLIYLFLYIIIYYYQLSYSIFYYFFFLIDLPDFGFARNLI